MTDTGKGWMMFVAALGMMLTLMAVEIANLGGWGEATTPVFIGKSMAHVGTVIAAFVGGKLIPAGRE